MEKLRPSHLYLEYLAPTVKRIISFSHWQRFVVEDHKYSICWLTTIGNINAGVITVQVCSYGPEDSCLSGVAQGCCSCVPGTPICRHCERKRNITRAIELYNEKGLNL